MLEEFSPLQAAFEQDQITGDELATEPLAEFEGLFRRFADVGLHVQAVNANDQ